MLPISFRLPHKYPITPTAPLSHTHIKNKNHPPTYIHLFIGRLSLRLPHTTTTASPVSHFPPVHSFTRTLSSSAAASRRFFHTGAGSAPRETAGFWSAKHRITIITRLLECAQCTESATTDAQNISCWGVWGRAALYTAAAGGPDSHLILSACVWVIMKELDEGVMEMGIKGRNLLMGVGGWWTLEDGSFVTDWRRFGFLTWVVAQESCMWKVLWGFSVISKLKRKH